MHLYEWKDPKRAAGSAALIEWKDHTGDQQIHVYHRKHRSGRADARVWMRMQLSVHSRI
jgi:hypothetical protein